MKNLKSQLLVLLLSLGCLLSGAYAQLTPSADSYTNTADPTTNFGTKTLLDVESGSHLRLLPLRRQFFEFTQLRLV